MPSGCSFGCTGWNPLACKDTGSCFIPSAPEPFGQEFPGKEEVGSKVLPAWVKIADVDFHEMFSGALNGSNTDSCVHCAPATVISSCPGTLKKYLHSTNRRFLCAAPMTTDYPPQGYHNFFVSLPRDTTAACFRGRIVAYSKGQLDAFANVSWLPFDYSPQCKGSPCEPSRRSLVRFLMTARLSTPGASLMLPNPVLAVSSNYTVIAGDYSGSAFPNARSSSIDGRYVDGLSLTVGCPSCQNGRQHVFTLATGTSVVVPPDTVLRTFSAALGTDTLVEDVFRCIWPPSGWGVGQNCFVGNCPCHMSDSVRASSLSPFSPRDFQVPDFVGSSYYCDGGAGPEDDQTSFGNDWKAHPMFSTSSTCVGGLPEQEQQKNASWWQTRGGFGTFEGFLAHPSKEPLEVRLLTGRDTFYENVGIAKVEIEACICSPGQGRDECIAVCTGAYVECAVGQVSSCSCTRTGSCACNCTTISCPENAVQQEDGGICVCDSGFRYGADGTCEICAYTAWPQRPAATFLLRPLHHTIILPTSASV